MPRDPAPDCSAAAALFLALATTVALAADDPRPWPPQYKLRPDQAARLTPADVVGPHGVVYPNWTRCGVQGGIPAIEAKAALGDFGGKPDDGADDAEALRRACEAVGRRGGGAVTLAKGVYHLDRPVTVRRDGVVIRGQGRDPPRLPPQRRPVARRLDPREPHRAVRHRLRARPRRLRLRHVGLPAAGPRPRPQWPPQRGVQLRRLLPPADAHRPVDLPAAAAPPKGPGNARAGPLRHRSLPRPPKKTPGPPKKTPGVFSHGPGAGVGGPGVTHPSPAPRAPRRRGRMSR